ncbi:MAG TPA: cell division protein FtsQ/DivIB [Allosphingosinicella sp.]|jgi:cell division protein FtsQ|nr:cell division protein FtsQ/DivIB [Allosphingosinicella sp.]
MNAKAARQAAPRGGKAKSKALVRTKNGRGKEPSPFADAVRRVSWWIFFLVLAALAVAALAAMGVPQRVGTSAGEAVGQAGFTLKHVEIKGAVHVPKLDVYNIAFDQAEPAMPLVDLEATRQRLLRFGWIHDARVSRRLPDTLVVDIVERKPAAIWQHNQQLALIDIDGVVLEPVKLDAMPDLPLIIGPNANQQAGALARLVEAAPQLKPAMAGASWVGDRRWDIRFQTGEVLALPEGEEAGRRALARFAQIDQQNQLLGKGFVRFDMRIPGKLIARLSTEPGGTVPSIAPATPPAAAAAPTNPAPAKPAAGDVDASKTI